MLEEVQDGHSKMAHKIYVGILLCIVLVIIPIQQLKRVFQYYRKYNIFVQALSQQTIQSTNELEIGSLYSLLSRNPYRGTWDSSIKRSQFLKEEQGKIQVKTILNQTQQANSYDLHIRIIDGRYRDNGYYDLIISSGSIKVNQRYETGKVLYETVSPLIGFYRKGHNLKSSEENALYINRLKFKVLAIQAQSKSQIKGLKMELLISSQYSINIIGRDLYQYQQTAHDIFLGFLLMAQFIAQGFGIYKLYEGIISQKQCSRRYSKRGFLISTILDTTEGIGLALLGTISTKKLAVFCLPILTIWIIIIVIELQMLTILFDEEFQKNSLKFSAKLCLLACVSFAICYFNNFYSFYFIAISLVAMIPQIYQNYMVGHKLKENMQYFLCYILPRYLCIPYLRAYQYNIFELEPDITLFLACVFILLFQSGLIFLQMQYGVRSIVPKFLHPEELKYFLSEQLDSQDDACSICLASLKKRGQTQKTELTQTIEKIREEPYNSIVLTPCKHKFHIQCLSVSMKTKLQCPNCRAILPPLEEYE